MISLSLTFAGIEAECRAVQASVKKGKEKDGKKLALDWWDDNFAHKYIDHRYDADLEEVVRRAR